MQIDVFSVSNAATLNFHLNIYRLSMWEESVDSAPGGGGMSS